MDTKRHPFLWILSASLFLSAVVLFVLFRFVVTPPAKADTSPDPMYTVGEWQGQVAVFEGEQTYPKQVYDMPVSGLPPELQQRLREGVPVYSDMELSVLLEDYTS
ncbi:MAG: hypothetical protein IJB36_04630 [Clostridia bacterium]|nr:hypothetical protein [Clostridia bacterium]